MISRGWLRPAEAAEYCGVSVKTFYGWLNEGLRWSRVGGCRLIKKDNLDAFIEGFEHRADADQIADEVVRGMAI